MSARPPSRLRSSPDSVHGLPAGECSAWRMTGGAGAPPRRNDELAAEGRPTRVGELPPPPTATPRRSPEAANRAGSGRRRLARSTNRESGCPTRPSPTTARRVARPSTIASPAREVVYARTAGRADRSQKLPTHWGAAGRRGTRSRPPGRPSAPRATHRATGAAGSAFAVRPGRPRRPPPCAPTPAPTPAEGPSRRRTNRRGTPAATRLPAG